MFEIKIIKVLEPLNLEDRATIQWLSFLVFVLLSDLKLLLLTAIDN